MRELSEQALMVLEERYLWKDKDGKVIETPNHMWWRVAKKMASVEDKDEIEWGNRFYNMLSNLDFLPNSPCLANAGKEGGQLAACMTADTIIWTLAGPKTIRELLDGTGKFQVYSTSQDGWLQIGNATGPKLTKHNANIVKVVFDDGTTLRVTPDHKIMMRDGNYKEAGSLTVGESVMPFRHYPNNKKYLGVFKHVDDTYTVKACRFVLEQEGVTVPPKWHVHHISHNTTDDRPENLVVLTNEEHQSHHMTDSNPMHNPEVAAKISVQMLGNKRAVGAVRSEETREKMGAWQRGKPKPWATKEARLARQNHKVVSVEDDGVEDVYDISVEYWNNFAAGNNGSGVFIHNCFVLPVEDNLERIFDSVKNAALIHKTGGGTGFDFSLLRPRNSIVASSGHAASGPVSFMEVFDAATGAIKQGGMRRGANMGILRVDHPDIIEFIHCKDSGGRITNFNISVGITDEFLQDLEHCKNGLHSVDKYGLHETCACSIWKDIAYSAWKTGDPGVVFLDVINMSRSNPVPSIGPITATNPCGEVPLYNYDSCNLGSINLANHVSTINGIDYAKLKDTIETAIRFMDNMVECNSYILPEIGERNKQLRRLGLGVMGLHDMLIKMEIPYASKEAVEVSYNLAKFIQKWADSESFKLGQERGDFPLFKESIYPSGGWGHMRNCARTCIAPTGTISIIADVSSGIEPLYALSYEHHGLEGKLRGKEIWNKAAKDYVDKHLGVIDNEVIDTALDIDPMWHLAHQAAWQEFTDNAVSKTINMPFKCTPEDIMEVYEKAFNMGCKGVTVFRNGCRTEQVLNILDNAPIDDEPTTDEDLEVIEEYRASKVNRDDVLPSLTFKQDTPFGHMYVTITENGSSGSGAAPYELFAQVSKGGSDIHAMTEAIGRLVSMILRTSGIGERRDRLGDVEDQLVGIGGGSSSGFGVGRIRSIPDAISKVIRRYLDGGKQDSSDGSVTNDRSGGSSDVGRVVSGIVCPECGNGNVAMQEGCEKCYECGWSRC